MYVYVTLWRVGVTFVMEKQQCSHFVLLTHIRRCQ